MTQRGPALRARPTRDWWPAAVVVLTLIPVAGVFTTSRIFFVRDLGLFFFSRHLWLRDTLLGGTAPLWDPYVAAGQAALPDALNQILMPITLAIRLIPSDVVSFNLWVAAPLPLAALGMYRFLRRRHGDIGALVGAVAFALSGPAVSMLNTPNLAWSVAALPWVLWSADRLIERPTIRCACALAVMVALQALSGEPVTMAATAAVVIVTTSFSWHDERWVDGRALLLVAGALAGGAMLAAAQLLPTFRAGLLAHRGALATPDFWSLHPLGLAEAFAPHVFGNYYNAFLVEMPWMSPLNSGREPFYYSLYVGPLVLLLGAAGVAGRPRRNAAWLVVGILSVVFALGGYTPVYPFLRKVIPPLAYFRFPVKYIAITAAATAVLAAEGWEVVCDPSCRRRVVRLATGASIVAVMCAAFVLAAATFVEPSLEAARWLATRVHVEDVNAGAHFLLRIALPLLARSIGLLLAGGGLLILAAGEGRHARKAALLLAAALCADLVVTNADLNPTSSLEKMTPPAWYRSLASTQRVYIGGRLRGYMNAKDPDASIHWEIPAEETAVEGRLELNAELPMSPSGWRVRETVSYDLPVLWPREYEIAMHHFEHAGSAERRAFLRRSAVRWCALRAEPDTRDGRLRFIQHWSMALYECNPGATRVFIASHAASGVDIAWQQAALFDPALPDEELRVERIPELEGRPNAPGPTSATITADDANALTVGATLRREGYVVVRDSYSPYWMATLDGRPVAIVRANGLYRAVRVPAGQHVIRFEYRPRDVMAGLTISGTTAVLLLCAWAWRPRQRNRPVADAGFTLVELMIVIAIVGILVGIAISHYGSAQRSANEGSAVASMRTIAAAEWEFAQTCGNQLYAPSLTALAQPVPTTGQPFLSPDLTAADQVEKSGYVFRVTGKLLMDVRPACNGTPVSLGFAATADPTRPKASGERYFGLNADRILYEDTEKTFIDNLGESGPPNHGSEVK